MNKINYREDGVVKDIVSAVVILFIGIGVLILILILVGVITGKAFTTVKPTIQAIDTCVPACTELGCNTCLGVEATLLDSIIFSFGSFGDAAGFLGIMILAIVFFLVLLLLRTGMGGFGGGQAF